MLSLPLMARNEDLKDGVALNSDFPRNEAVVNKEVGLARPEDAGLAPVEI